jgi:hypothetical protein
MSSEVILPQRCGVRGLQPCPDGRVCVKDPNQLDCSNPFDCPGYCLLLDGNDCTKDLGGKCPSPEQVCVDDPRDDCFPDGDKICLAKCVFFSGRSSAMYLEE